MSALPTGPLVAYYGDDFTGSAAVMEVMTCAGLDSVMFLDVPTPERLAAFRDRRCIGIAGVARSKSPDWMADHLPRIYAALLAIDAPLLHYKVCSTFDSAPHIGSIGKAIDLGAEAIPARFVPLVVAAPALHRYQLFGNLFAAADGAGHRLDRHPTMSRHPVTPMDEADITRHLAKQTRRPVRLVDLMALRRTDDPLPLAGAESLAPVLAIDVVDDSSQAAAGRLIWRNRSDCRFVAGSQGVEYALVAHWRADGLLSETSISPRAAPVDRIAVVSGSCSPVTAEQIAHAETRGFAALALDVVRAVDPDAWQRECMRVAAAAVDLIDQGHSPLVHTARGPNDAAVAALGNACRSAGRDMAAVNEAIGAGLGSILDHILARTRISRALIAGGDTSGHATLMLGVDALSVIAEIAPGSPLCRAYAEDSARDGLELALKGGQIGNPDYFSAVRAGGSLASA